MRESPLYDLHAQGLEELEGMLGQEREALQKGLVWLGVWYPSVKSSLAVGTTIEWGGKLFDVKFSLTVREEVVRGAAQPFASGKTLLYDGAEYRIVNVREPAPGASWRLDVIDPNR